ncbi:hypothetical protein SH668x_002562 [Planctomicrobium sp. SH668]|uniref:hypothetical protein n=1 Tax=Planctomicrobium sp. SH668 TaxID=3448126 RepID=UPI003F5AFDC9
MKITPPRLLPVLLAVFLLPIDAIAQDPFDLPPILYRQSSPEDQVSELQQRISNGELQLEFDEQFGFLLDLLKALDISTESQMLVYSKTSLQTKRINTRTPRALYFNDEVYVGYCVGGDVIELTAMDPQLGAVFYTLEQDQGQVPHFKREVDNCLNCHSSSRTGNVPGLLARSLFVDVGGQPKFSAGSKDINHSSPLEDRWGGWYVTGTHGVQKHLGNLIVRTAEVKFPIDNESGHNVTDLSDRLNLKRYPAAHSDLVALMVFEHQLTVHNQMTQASYSVRQALESELTMNRAFNEPEGTRRESTTRRIRNAADKLVEVLLLSNEAKLTEPIAGTSLFAAEFAAKGERDHAGRSLRDLDLQNRLFKYPCSFLIASQSFRGLPEELKAAVWERLKIVLEESEGSEKFKHLSPEDRRQIQEILLATVPEATTYWKREADALN